MAFLITLFNSLPILDKWLDKFLTAYAEFQKTQQRNNLRASLLKAITVFDQRDLEDDSISGKPSGQPGVEIREHTE